MRNWGRGGGKLEGKLEGGRLWGDVCFLGGEGLKTLKTLKTLCLSRLCVFKWVLSVLSGGLKTHLPYSSLY
jgi:hypothetical protein